MTLKFLYLEPAYFIHISVYFRFFYCTLRVLFVLLIVPLH